MTTRVSGMLSKELENTLNETFRTARARRHEFITVEHLLLALLDDPTAVVLTFSFVGADVGDVRQLQCPAHDSSSARSSMP